MTILYFMLFCMVMAFGLFWLCWWIALHTEVGEFWGDVIARRLEDAELEQKMLDEYKAKQALQQKGGEDE